MDRFKFNYATVIALAVLLFYAYIAAMGSLFRKGIDGRIWMAVLVFLAIFVLAFLCIVMMCKAKATRWKNIGTSGQIGFGIAILAVLLIAGIPFSTFLKAATEQETITGLVTAMKEDAKQLDQAYNNHVAERVAHYEDQLKQDSTMTTMEITNRVNSLRNHLSPELLPTVQNKREEWIDGIGEMSVWDIMMRKNLGSLDTIVQKWDLKYRQMDSLKFAGEDYRDYFTYNKFEVTKNDKGEEQPSAALGVVLDDLGKFHYSGYSVLIALLCWLFMLLPWLITRKSLA